MNANRLVAITAILSLLLSVFIFWKQFDFEQRANTRACNVAHRNGEAACEQEKNLALGRISFDSTLATLEHSQRMIQCNLIFEQVAKQECRNEEEQRFAGELESIEQRKSEVLVRYNECIAQNDLERDECLATPTDQTEIAPGLKTEFDLSCIDGPGAPCFKKVPEICQQIAGVCEDCWNAFCPGSVWQLETDRPVQISLITEGSGEASRVLTKASFRGGRYLLEVPKAIDLKEGEELVLKFQPDDPNQLGIIAVKVYH